MSLIDLVGWVGSAILVWSLLQSRILRLRLFNLLGSAILLAFNAIIGVWPMVGLNAVLCVINLVYLQRMLRSRHSATSYSVVEIRPDDPYLRHLLAEHGADIVRFNPGLEVEKLVAERSGSGEAFLVLHGDETVGYVFLHDLGAGVAQIDLDYVTERFRDFTPGEFVFRRSRLLAEHGYTSVVTRRGVSAPYYEKIGFTAMGDVFELALTRDLPRATT
ncbi:hypothetical protein [Sanguibacter antarcticus]|uniref:Inner membrane protein n=1 Tax=Sanguibacter antarcticus TaxID=372484 RepID=A0A2A9E7Q9_9MICO|nr:hypothetical protein [Sanguibacter antarcticus]PFG34988.1 hypothetical protein ATL42_2920 [Sanguibacter antarcticus]